MSRDKVKTKNPVEWNLAIQIAGSEGRLTYGVKEKTWKSWFNTKLVPADRILPFLMERLDFTAMPRHYCEFLDFTAMVADYQQMRRVVLALTGSDDEKRRAEAIMDEAQRLTKEN